MSILRFPIRDLYWLILLAAVVVSWWVDRGRLQFKVRELQLLLFTTPIGARASPEPNSSAPALNMPSE